MWQPYISPPSSVLARWGGLAPGGRWVNLTKLAAETRDPGAPRTEEPGGLLHAEDREGDRPVGGVGIGLQGRDSLAPDDGCKTCFRPHCLFPREKSPAKARGGSQTVPFLTTPGTWICLTTPGGGGGRAGLARRLLAGSNPIPLTLVKGEK